MTDFSQTAVISPIESNRSRIIFESTEERLHKRTDRLFAWLMLFQWLGGIAAASCISPKSWEGTTSSIHWHVWAAIFFSGAIFSFPLVLIWKRPGRALTRHMIAVAQMLFCGLLIHLTGGRIETHFQIFGVLAFLAFYRDWKVLLSATVVTALDHLLRGLFWPQSIFGVLTASPWRWFEHAGWVIFEDVFLFISIRQSLSNAFNLAERQAALETINTSIEQKIIERTAELTNEIAERKNAQIEQARLHHELVDISRQAGMAEVATSVLHNVGNVLNSVNVSGSIIADKLRDFRVVQLTRVSELLQKNENDLAAFFTSDPRGRKLPDFISKLAAHMQEEQEEIVREADALMNNIIHIKDIVAMQQNYGKTSGVLEVINMPELVEVALRMNEGAEKRHQIKMVCELAETPPVLTDKHKVLQILVNLIRNAQHACADSNRDDKQIILRVRNGEGRIKTSVIDNGVGIPAENLTRIFNHGFTTKKDGHGFGLHSGALAAREMGGTLTVFSEGAGRGASFTLDLPAQNSKTNA
jgi:signal transduction histidine kinase